MHFIYGNLRNRQRFLLVSALYQNDHHSWWAKATIKLIGFLPHTVQVARHTSLLKPYDFFVELVDGTLKKKSNDQPHLLLSPHKCSNPRVISTCIAGPLAIERHSTCLLIRLENEVVFVASWRFRELCGH